MKIICSIVSVPKTKSVSQNKAQKVACYLGREEAVYVHVYISILFQKNLEYNVPEKAPCKLTERSFVTLDSVRFVSRNKD